MSISQSAPAAHNCFAMEERNIRVANLKRLVAAAGGTASFVRLHPGVDPTYVSQLINGHRSFGERSARNMEIKIGLDRGSLDISPDVSSGGEWPFKTIAAARFDRLPDHLKGVIEGRALTIIEEWEAEQSKSDQHFKRSA